MKLKYVLRGIYFGSNLLANPPSLTLKTPLPPLKVVWFTGEEKIRVFKKSTPTYGYLKYKFKKL